MAIDYQMTHVAIQEKLSSTVNAYTWEIFATATSELSKRRAVSSGGKVIKCGGNIIKQHHCSVVVMICAE